MDGIKMAIVEIPKIKILTSPSWKDYELIDSGNGLKLERYGGFRLVRPEAEAIWSPSLSEKEWNTAHATFQASAEENGGHWAYHHSLPERWIMEYKDLRFWVQTTASRHLGVFPEQAAQWDWIEASTTNSSRPIKVLNLFGYTGLASLAAARAGAQVTHVDASRKVMTWAHENQQLCSLGPETVRWIVEDALKFVQREKRRGVWSEGMILDPPKFGRGPKGEVWEFYRLLPELLDACKGILSPEAVFVIITAYAVKASSVTLYYALKELIHNQGGKFEAGEVALVERSAGRTLSLAVFARWSR
jgi:23S rRNA (cytosine1962-C5)-methyltransferase